MALGGADSLHWVAHEPLDASCGYLQAVPCGFGLDSLLRHVSWQARLLGNETDGDLHAGNQRWRFLSWATSGPLGTHLSRSEQLLTTDASNVIHTLRVLFGVSMALKIIVLLTVHRMFTGPLLERVRLETNRVASLLSFLPSSVDIRKIVASQLSNARSRGSGAI